MASRHTIVLVQTTNGKGSRSFFDFETVSGALDEICRMYEQRLKTLNPNVRNITYDVADLYAYIDSLPDLSALIFDPPTQFYRPVGKPEIKQKILKHLQAQAQVQSKMM